MSSSTPAITIALSPLSGTAVLAFTSTCQLAHPRLDSLVLPGDVGDLGGQWEHDVEVSHRQTSRAASQVRAAAPLGQWRLRQEL